MLNTHWSERITNNEVRSRTHQPQTQSVQDVFAYLDTSAELTPPRITGWHYWSVSAKELEEETWLAKTDITAANSGGLSSLVSLGLASA